MLLLNQSFMGQQLVVDSRDNLGYSNSKHDFQLDFEFSEQNGDCGIYAFERVYNAHKHRADTIVPNNLC